MYAYVRNNPLKNTDPDGRACYSVGSCIDTAIGTLKAVGNIPSGIVNAPNRLADAIVAPFNGGQRVFGDLVPDSFTPTNHDQAEAMGATNMVLMFTPAVEAGATEAVSATGAEVPQITQNAARGAASEARVLNDLGLPKNTAPVTSAEGKSIPDFQTRTTVGEIKDVKQLSNTQQIRIQRDAAQQSGREHVVITGTNKNVAPTVQKPPQG
jgi:hypothetical protein